MTDYNEHNLQRIFPLLRGRRLVLMVGAGSSMFVGYKSWDGLVESLATELNPPLTRSDGTSASEFADAVRNQFVKDHRLVDYHNSLEALSGPDDKPKQYDEMHLSLVRLGCRGIATTNYDPVLEMAITVAFKPTEGMFRCEPIDMCGLRLRQVDEFKEGLAEKKEPKFVLHLHGYFRNPAGIILTESDYEEKYGLALQFDEEGNPVDKALRTEHTRLLYSLLSTYPFFFVGFSLSDKFFMYVLSIVQADLERGTTVTHFATMPFRTEQERIDIEVRLRQHGIGALFYYVPPHRDGEPPDHSALKALILDLAEASSERRGITPEVAGRDWRNLSIELMER